MLASTPNCPVLVVHLLLAALLPWTVALPSAPSARSTPSAISQVAGLEPRGYRPELLFPRPESDERSAMDHMEQQQGPGAEAVSQRDREFEARKRNGLFKPFELCC